MINFRYSSRIIYRPFIFYIKSCLVVRYFSLTSIKADKNYSEKVEDQGRYNNSIQNYSFTPNNVSPVKIYENALLSKSEMIKDFKDKTIIYLWFNKITGKVYVGSGRNEANRLYSYFSPSVLNSTNKSLIYNSLNKYGHNNFSLVILEDLGFFENVDKQTYLERESFYITWALINYEGKTMNILTTAGSSLGYVHTDESRKSIQKLEYKNSMFNKVHLVSTKEAIGLAMKEKGPRGHDDITKKKIGESHKGKTVSQETRDKISSTLKNRVISKETRAKISAALSNKLVSLSTRELMSRSRSKPILVTNINTNEQTVYSSIKETAEKFNITSTKVRNHKKKSIMFDLYLVDYKQNVS